MAGIGTPPTADQCHCLLVLLGAHAPDVVGDIVEAVLAEEHLEVDEAAEEEDGVN